MASETPQSAGEPAGEASTEDQPKAKFFRKKFTTARLPADSAQRQGRIATLAFEKLGRDAAQAFLNNHDEALGGRPLDIAVASAEGLHAVEAAIVARSAGKGG